MGDQLVYFELDMTDRFRVWTTTIFH